MSCSFRRQQKYVQEGLRLRALEVAEVRLPKKP